MCKTRLAQFVYDITKSSAESWNPMWSVGTILNGLLSFMYENNITTGSISTSKAEKRRLAAISLEQNLRSPTFRKLFPEWAQEHQQRQNAAQVRSSYQCCLPLTLYLHVILVCGHLCFFILLVKVLAQAIS